MAAGYEGWVKESQEVVFGSDFHFGGGLGGIGDIANGAVNASTVVANDDEVFVRVGWKIIAGEVDGVDECAVDKDVDLVESVIQDEMVPFL